MVKHPRESRYSRDVNRINEMKEIFEMHFVHHMQEKEILSLKGLNKGTYYQILRKFAAEYPELAEQMKKKGRDIVPDDYRKLLEEVSTLKTQLKKEKLQVVSRLYTRDSKAYPVKSQCKLLGVSSQAYYKHGDGDLRKLAEEAFCVEFIKRVRQKDHGIGGGKLWKMYKREFGDGHSVGYNRFYDIVEKYNLKVRKKKRRAKTTDSAHDLPLYPNLVKELIPLRPNQLWVSDITYMVVYRNAQTGEYDFCYLSLVTDYYTKEIIGWCVGETLEAKFAIKALNMALKRLGDNPVPDLIHHSDRGVQYASYDYTGILKKHGIKISMTECGDPKDNAVAERVNGIIKNELLMGVSFFSIEEIRRALKVAIDFYNNERPHMSLDWKTPAEAALCTGELEKKWVSYREKAIKDLAA